MKILIITNFVGSRYSLLQSRPTKAVWNREKNTKRAIQRKVLIKSCDTIRAKRFWKKSFKEVVRRKQKASAGYCCMKGKASSEKEHQDQLPQSVVHHMQNFPIHTDPEQSNSGEHLHEEKLPGADEDHDQPEQLIPGPQRRL